MHTHTQNAFFSAISPFLDPATRAKIRFNAKLHEFIESDMLDAEFGGAHRYVWDFDKVRHRGDMGQRVGLRPDGLG